MPEAGEHPHNENVQELPGLSLPVAAQGNVDIVPEPGAQGDVPPAPEFRNAAGNIGILKVLRKPEAKEPPQADGHITVAGEIKIDVQGEADGIEPGEEHAGVGRLPPGGADFPQKVGKQHFFAQSDEKPPGALPDACKVVGAAAELPGNVGIPDNGPRDELGEKGDVAGKVDEVLLGGCLPPVYVNGVAENLKGVEADAHRQRQLQKSNGPAGEGAQVFQEKIRVLKAEEKTQAGKDGGRQKPLFGLWEPLHGKAEAIAEDRGGQHDHKIPGLAPGIEQKAEQQQDPVSARLRHQIVGKQDAGKKII